ncbi:protein-disulfide isomerase [Leptospira ognonensis]|uniref:Protein-disulfide isomerase n=1 Tax=Leptospira ognonensis TaxID=2484945 RepID=A0A4R9JS60_9LEPT|nr:thioredoxin domain-containing protein [Leptospira ognonensis]TGL54901.1 protein-disulfide isomerase [Leptospira ognonensis]
MDQKKLNIIGVFIAFLGVVLSFILAIEYFGLGSANIADSACSALGGAGSCAKVAESAYSFIPSVPLLGNVPIALFGFGFYGTLVFLFGMNVKSTNPEENLERLQIVLGLSSLAFLFDLVLFGISVGVIGTICQLCAITYVITLLIIGISFYALKESKINPKNVVSSVTKSLGTLFIIFLFNFSVAFATSKLATSKGSNTLATSEGMDNAEITNRIAAFEAGEKLNIDLSGSASIGSATAPIVIVKYADFNCGHCLHTSHILAKLLADYDGMVRVVYKNFPLDGSCNRLVSEPRPGASSCIAAMAAICADKQGKFAAMYHGLYDNTEKGVTHSASTVLNLANTLSINTNQLKSCMSSKEAQMQLNKEIDVAEKLNIQATPSLYINDKKIDSGTPNPIFLKALLDRLISKL